MKLILVVDPYRIEMKDIFALKEKYPVVRLRRTSYGEGPAIYFTTLEGIKYAHELNLLDVEAVLERAKKDNLDSGPSTPFPPSALPSSTPDSEFSGECP